MKTPYAAPFLSALPKAYEEETGKAPVLDPDFAEDVEEIFNHRKPGNPPEWE